MSTTIAGATPSATTPIPRQIRYIIGNEGCERFSFYGMRNILTLFLVTSLLRLSAGGGSRTGAAKDVFHTFVIGVYFFPLLGGWLSDRFFGKYNTILWLSLVYCVGQACLALFDDNAPASYVGLFLIALGSGGIKPLRRVVRRRSVRSDEQASRQGRVRRVLLDHQLRLVLRVAADADLPARTSAPAIAFGIPGVLMFIATVVLWLGRKQYVMVPPAPPNPHSFLRVVADARFGRQDCRGQTFACARRPRWRSFSFLRSVSQLGFVISACLALVVDHRLRRHRRLAAARACARQPSRRSRRRRARRCCASWCCSRSSRRSGRSSIRRRRRGSCRRTP